MVDVDLRYIERDGKRILQWRKAYSGIDAGRPVATIVKWSVWEDVTLFSDEPLGPLGAG